MHPPLTLHLNPECVDVILAFTKCHEEVGYWGRLTGACNEQKRALEQCFKCAAALGPVACPPPLHPPPWQPHTRCLCTRAHTFCAPTRANGAPHTFCAPTRRRQKKIVRQGKLQTARAERERWRQRCDEQES